MEPDGAPRRELAQLLLVRAKQPASLAPLPRVLCLDRLLEAAEDQQTNGDRRLRGPDGGPCVVLGRDMLLASVRIDSKALSRRHCGVYRVSENTLPHAAVSFYIRDFGAKNGTFVNWRRVPVDGTVPLLDGDVVCFGAGGMLKAGERLSEGVVAGQEPIVYKFLHTPSTPELESAPVRKTMFCSQQDVAEYTQVDCSQDEKNKETPATVPRVRFGTPVPSDSVGTEPTRVRAAAVTPLRDSPPSLPTVLKQRDSVHSTVVVNVDEIENENGEQGNETEEKVDETKGDETVCLEERKSEKEEEQGEDKKEKETPCYPVSPLPPPVLQFREERPEADPLAQEVHCRPPLYTGKLAKFSRRPHSKLSPISAPSPVVRDPPADPVESQCAEDATLLKQQHPPPAGSLNEAGSVVSLFGSEGKPNSLPQDVPPPHVDTPCPPPSLTRSSGAKQKRMGAEGRAAKTRRVEEKEDTPWPPPSVGAVAKKKKESRSRERRVREERSSNARSRRQSAIEGERGCEKRAVQVVHSPNDQPDAHSDAPTRTGRRRSDMFEPTTELRKRERLSRSHSSDADAYRLPKKRRGAMPRPAWRSVEAEDSPSPEQPEQPSESAPCAEDSCSASETKEGEEEASLHEQVPPEHTPMRRGLVSGEPSPVLDPNRTCDPTTPLPGVRGVRARELSSEVAQFEDEAQPVHIQPAGSPFKPQAEKLSRSGFQMFVAERVAGGALAKMSQKQRRIALLNRWKSLPPFQRDEYDRQAIAALERQIPGSSRRSAPETPHNQPTRRGGVPRTRVAKLQERARVRACRNALFADIEEDERQMEERMDHAESEFERGSAREAPRPPTASPVESQSQHALAVPRGGIAQFAAAQRCSKVTDERRVSSRFLGAGGTKAVFIPSSISKLLKEHQVRGVRFMWKQVVSIPDAMRAAAHSEGRDPDDVGFSGCVLAHGMGLGKTWTSIAFMLMWLRTGRAPQLLVIAPKSTLRQWEAEWQTWSRRANHECPEIYVVESSKKARASIEKWAFEGGVLILSYALYVRFTCPPAPKSPCRAGEKEAIDREAERVQRASQFAFEEDEAEQREVEEAARDAARLADGVQERERIERERVAQLMVTSAALVIVDEGHKISSPSGAFTRALHLLRTRDRIVLSGTPMLTKMREYHTMIDFVRPGYFGRTELEQIYARASNPSDDAARTELSLIIRDVVQRIPSSRLQLELPPLREYILYVNVSTLQRNLHQALEVAERERALRQRRGPGSKSRALFAMGVLQRICLHTELAREFVINSGVPDPDAPPEEGDDFDIARQSVRGGGVVSRDGRDFSWASALFATNRSTEAIMRSNPRVLVLLKAVQHVIQLGEKCLVFCDSAALLRQLESPLQTLRVPSLRALAGASKAMRRDVHYHVLDGSLSTTRRQQLCEDFNDPNSCSCICLVSTRAAGLGVNLTGATRVFLYGASWNSQTDIQAIHRAYRYGQDRPVSVYRLLARGTVEEFIFNRATGQDACEVALENLQSFGPDTDTDWSRFARHDTVLQRWQESRVSRHLISAVIPSNSLQSPFDPLDSDGDEVSGEEEPVESGDSGFSFVEDDESRD